MGSLRKYMPYTWLFMFIAALSLMGVPPLPGFWSKDLVLISTLHVHVYPLFLIAIITVIVTSFYSLRFIGMVFHGKESENVATLKKKGKHVGEALPVMVVACGALAVGIVVVGIFGLKLEHFLGESFGYALERLHLTIVHPESAGLFVPALSVLTVLIGAVVAYVFYISRKIDPARFLEKRLSLKAIHKFFWNRWYIDDVVYYKFFVGGINTLAAAMPKYIEGPLNKVFHEFIPALPGGIYGIIKHMKTESKEMTFNLLYVILLFIVILFVMLFLGGPQ
jgi:NADH-quinone oxidoreductase subunit L